MRAHGAEPIRMEHVAAVAGCSLRTLEAVFNRFRDQTPLAALHRIRLDLVRDELANRSTEAVVSEVAPPIRLRQFGAICDRLSTPVW